MRRSHLLILLALTITAITALSFPSVKRNLEIRSETRKWQEKWENRPTVQLSGDYAFLARANKIPENIAQDLTLSLAKSPWIVSSHLTVGREATLNIDPGVEIFIAPEADIQVYGRILALGTTKSPIRMSAYSGNGTDAWAGLFFRSDRASKFNHVNFENSRYGARLVFSTVTWDQCIFKNVREICSGYESSLAFNRSLFDYREFSGSGNINVMKLYRGDLQVEHSDFYTPSSDYKVDGIDADYVNHAVIRGNRFFGGNCQNSDAIDIGHGSRNIVIENNLITDFIDKGVSVGEKAEALVNNNVIAGCAIGVGVKDGARVTITKTTFYNNDYAIRSYEKVAGKGGGSAAIDHSLIVLSKKEAVTVDPLSTLIVTNSLCDNQLLPGMNNLQGTAEFKNPAEHDFNIVSISLASTDKISSPGNFGAKL